MAFIQEAQADAVGIRLPGDVFDGKAACSQVDPAHKLPPQCQGQRTMCIGAF